MPVRGMSHSASMLLGIYTSGSEYALLFARGFCMLQLGVRCQERRRPSSHVSPRQVNMSIHTVPIQSLTPSKPLVISGCVAYR